ncbi:hypothetical protein CDV57_04042 [Aspergillus fumigatus]|nr:hypothetical protein CDV57_04042 [Aspergillus fumigatus]
MYFKEPVGLASPVQKEAIFRNGSTANLDASFTPGQIWVNSTPKTWRPPKHSTEHPPNAASPNRPNGESTVHSPSQNGTIQGRQKITSPTFPSQRGQNGDPHDASPPSAFPFPFPSPTLSPMSNHTNYEDTLFYSGAENTSNDRNTGFAEGSPSARGAAEHDASSLSSTAPALSASASIQESCLLRYFIEEVSPWFDHCDDRRHFQLVVPCRAQHCPTLRYAIFAVSARHLCRLPQYRTRRGILYGGQLLPHLQTSSAVEYMLKCIPGLAEFPNIQDPTHQENIMAAAVILRQSEEMEEETGEGRGRMEAEYDDDERVNFLAVTQRIIDSVIASPLDHSLATAAYWIVIRQEIYYALTRETVPHLRFDSDRWPNASIANNMIMFVGKVAQWRWGQKSLDEWTRLKLDEQKLIRESLGKMEPILELKADRAKGQIFPTVWYSFDVHATAAQHFQLAQMILTAENPQLVEANRAAHRKAEAQVRSIVLNLCGIALNHPRVQPCLVNAVIAITLYGDYFTDHEEREALVGIINRTRDLHVWQMKKPYQTLLRRWEAADSAEI